MQIQKGQLIELEISDAGEHETCFGRLENGMGVFVSGALAVGDRVEAEVRKRKRNHLEARLVQVLQPSPLRVSPPCPHFGLCGGCKWQHVQYEEQLRVKRKMVADALHRLGGFEAPPVEEVLPAPEPYGYRNKVDFTFGRRRFLPREELDLPPESSARPEDYALGFHVPRRFEKVLDIESCLLASPEMNRVLDIVKRYGREQGLLPYSTFSHDGYLRNLVIRRGEHADELMVYLVTSSFEPDHMQALSLQLQEALGKRLTTFVNGVTDRKNQVAFAEELHVVHGPGRIREKMGAFTFLLSPNTFFQTNTRQAERLVQTAVDLAAIEPQDTVYDLYCGAGAISLFLAKHAAKVLGIEAIAAAVADAGDNAERNGIGNCAYRVLDLRALGSIRESLEAFGLPRVIVTDPPRAGMHPKAVAQMVALGAERIVYVSCKPASLARDAAQICEEGRYRLVRVQPVDMFPQTQHIESVALLERVG